MGRARPIELQRRHAVAAAALAVAGALFAASVSVFTFVLAGIVLHLAYSVAHGRRLDSARAWSLFLGIGGMAGAVLGGLAALGSGFVAGAVWMGGLFLLSAGLLVIVQRALRPAA